VIITVIAASAAANYKHLSVIAISELAQISRRLGRTGVKPQKYTRGPSALYRAQTMHYSKQVKRLILNPD
jgi:hypothetical protein